MNAYDYTDVDPADVAGDRSLRSISCTPSCAGCSSPECGYCERKREALYERRLSAVYGDDADELIAAMRSDGILAYVVQDVVSHLAGRLSFVGGQYRFDVEDMDKLKSLTIRLTSAVELAVTESINEDKAWSRGIDRRAA